MKTITIPLELAEEILSDLNQMAWDGFDNSPDKLEKLIKNPPRCPDCILDEEFK